MKLTRQQIVDFAKDGNTILRANMVLEGNEAEVVEIIALGETLLVLHRIYREGTHNIDSAMLDELSNNVENWNVYRLDESLEPSITEELDEATENDPVEESHAV